jgi:RsiW-degrading membrane proteinase PrsW (M82 family)
MLDNTIFVLSVSTILAAIPAIIWLFILFNKNETSKKTIFFIFFLGTLTAPALLGLQYFWQEFPQFNLEALIQDNITRQSTKFILIFVLFGALEEVIKHFAVSKVDQKTILIKTIGDCIRYSITAALGFSFAENVYYLYVFWQSLSVGELVGMYAFRSIITACAHMIFSGVFAYFYGMGKFSIYLQEKINIEGKKPLFQKILMKLFSFSPSKAFKKYMIYKGLFIAVTMHAIYNYLLQYNIIPPTITFVVLGYLYLQYLLSKNTGKINLITDISEKEKSTMPYRDKEVITELLGEFLETGRYQDTINVCDRFLEKDPDNNVVKLLKAEAQDKINQKESINSIIRTSSEDKNVLTNYIKKAPKLPAKTPLKKQEQKTESLKKLLEKHTGDGTFDLN